MPESFHLRPQHGQMDRDHLPNAREVYSQQVIVDQNVPDSRNGAPVNLGMKGF